jgi:hypothetical protein
MPKSKLINTKKNKKTVDISTQVMDLIHQGKVVMRPKIYFVLGSILLGIGLASSILVAIFFINIFLFKFRAYTPHTFLKFGRLGIIPFLRNFPWLPLGVSIGGITSGTILLAKYDIAYKKSFKGLIVTLTATTLVLGFFISKSRLNEKIQLKKPLRPFYVQKFQGLDWVTGEIASVGNKEVTINNPKNQEVHVLWNDNTKLPTGGNFEINNHIKAVGKWNNDKFIATGIIRIPSDKHKKEVRGIMRQSKFKRTPQSP